MASPRTLMVEDDPTAAMELERWLNHLVGGIAGLTVSRGGAHPRMAAPGLDLIPVGLRPRWDMADIEATVEVQLRGNAGLVFIGTPVGCGEVPHSSVGDPLAYILKPFKEGVIYTLVHMAFHQYKLEKTLQRLRERERELTTALKCIGDAVLTTDVHGRTTFMNSVAVGLTGWSQQDALGKNFTEVLNIGNEPASRVTDTPVTKALRDGAVSLAADRVLVDKDGTQTLIDYSATPIKDMRGNIAGAVVVFRRVTEREPLRASQMQTRDGRALYHTAFAPRSQ